MQILPKTQQGTQPLAELAAQQHARGLSRAFIALRHRNFRLFWFGQLISLVGTWMQTIGQSWLVLELTHSALWLGVVGALQFLPVMLFALFGGVLADRLPKRKVFLHAISRYDPSNYIWILVATGEVRIWHVLVLALLLGLTNALDMPTRQAFVVEMVGREELPNAIALNSSLFNMARIIGPWHRRTNHRMAWRRATLFPQCHKLYRGADRSGNDRLEAVARSGQKSGRCRGRNRQTKHVTELARRTGLYMAYALHPAYHHHCGCCLPVRHQLQCRAAAFCHGGIASWCSRIWLHFGSLRGWRAALSALAGMGQ